MKNFDQSEDGERTLAGGDDGDQKLLFSVQRSLDRIPVEEGWIALCARAAVEQDPKKLLDLVIEINRQLDARRKRLLNESDGKSEHK
jgi:hypothetical protein